MTAEPLDSLLGEHPLPRVEGDKENRGSVVLVAGSGECPGAVLLAGVAALRSGAGRVQVVTDPQVAVALAVAFPEALVLPWGGGGPLPHDVRSLLESATAVCIGPGLGADAAARVALAAPAVAPDVPVLLDARAIVALDAVLGIGSTCLVMPNEREAARVIADADCEARPQEALARRLSGRTGAAAAVRGACTVLAERDGCWECAGTPGLGTSGSGDVLAGVAVGLLARNIKPVAALGWAIAVHAWAGHELGGDRANPGYLARELVDLVPAAMEALTKP